MARTLLARLQWLFRTRTWVPRKKSHGLRFEIILVDLPFDIENVYCKYSLEFEWEHTKYLRGKENREDIPIMPPDLAL